MAKMTGSVAKDIDEYIAGFEGSTKKRLVQVRNLIRKIVPEAEEAISYAIPTFRLNGKNLVHFAAFENHIGFYPAPVGMEAFKKDLKDYKTGKGSVQFPHGDPLPTDLISRMTKFRVTDLTSKNSKPKKK